MMKKAALAVSLLAGLGIGVGTAQTARPQKAPLERNSTIIIELDRSLDSLTKEGVKNVQKYLYESIKANVTSNIDLVSSYSVLNNAIAISINDSYIEDVKSLPGVKSVTVDKLHFVSTMSEGSTISISRSGEYGGSENVSATTMNKGSDTNDGEGTVIAILDNEFYFKGKTDDNDPWNHVAFTDLGEDVVVKFKTRPNITATHAYTDTNEGEKSADRKAKIDGTPLGSEGSLYFNKKIPFYFDYGGERETHGGDIYQDFDVSSTVSYHGSHVASISAGNDPDYKGIAPKAQLVCMKVFTNFKASDIDKELGFGDSTGAYEVPILNALEDCITLGVDGINMSLGSNLDDFDSDSITLKTLTKLSNQGILSSISAGNSGKSSYSFAGAYGNWTKDMVETGILSSYSNNTEVTTVASGQPTKVFYESAIKLGDELVSFADQIVNSEYRGADYDEEHKLEDLITDSLGHKDYTKDLEWQYIGGYGQSKDYSGMDVEGKIAVVNRGVSTFSDKYETAYNAGAIALIVINNDPTASDFNFSFSFGDTKVKFPVVSVLFRDKPLFDGSTTGGVRSGTFRLAEPNVYENLKSKTISTFSSDGVAYNLELKPDITAPGDYIKGAVPPQKKEDKEDPYKSLRVYEFLSGTSMSAPNYAGAQSVVYSKVAKDALAAKDWDKMNYSEKLALQNFRETVDMRLLSTAVPMTDYEANKENNQKSLTSPRLQGAGMADIDAAYKTSVYLEGVGTDGKGTGKAKVSLKNSDAINKGNVSISVIGHNESTVDKSYSAKLTVMRPAIVKSADFVTGEYNYRGEVESFASFPGMKQYQERLNSLGEIVYVEVQNTGTFKNGDVFKVTKELEYYKTAEACQAKVYDGKIAMGTYINKGDDKNANWEIWEGKDYQSTQDVVIAEVDLGDVTFGKGTENTTTHVVTPKETKVTLNTYSLTPEQKTEINSFFSYGCYLEGYVSLTPKDASDPKLNLVWNGFYAGGEKTVDDAPVVEPFGFEKDNTRVYPSDLVNDIAKSLIGKTNVDFGSTMVSTYVEPGKEITTDKVLSNDESWTHLCEINSNYHLMGVDPSTGKFSPDSANNLYAGNPERTNTIIIQQFVLRSVSDNFITLTNKKTGKQVAREVLSDFLFGEYMNTYPLYKSHVDDSYLGAGYVAHRAYGVIPLFDSQTGKSYPSGDYELKFNYKLAMTGNWVSKSYTLHIDSDSPEITKISKSGSKVRFQTNETNLQTLIIGSNAYDFSLDKSGKTYFEVEQDELLSAIDANINPLLGTGRLFVLMNDKAGGSTGSIIRFEEKGDSFNFNKYTIVSSTNFGLSVDFEDNGDSITFFLVDGTVVTPFEPSYKYKVLRSGSGKSNGCGGNIATASIILSTISVIGIALLLISKKKKQLGGKK